MAVAVFDRSNTLPLSGFLAIGLWLVACDGVNPSQGGVAGDSCTRTADCAAGLRCIELVCVDPDGDTTGGASGDTFQGSTGWTGGVTWTTTGGTASGATSGASSSTLTTTSWSESATTVNDEESHSDITDSTNESASGETTEGGTASEGSEVGGDEQSGTTGDGDDAHCEHPNEGAFIWIANSENGTVSKISTANAVEVARYRTGPSSIDRLDPARVSVNLCGDVAIANRSGSVVKVAGHSTRCVDTNGDGRISTSTGPNDVLAWGEDECVLWWVELPFTPPPESTDNSGGPRALAWDLGDPDHGPGPGCSDTSRLWVGWRDQPGSEAIYRLMNGCSGQTEAELEVPNLVGGWEHGPYVAAVDGNNDLWSMTTLGVLVHIEAETHEVSRWRADLGTGFVRSYGLVLDVAGRPHFSTLPEGNLIRFDPGIERFVDLGSGGGKWSRGISMAKDGKIWVADGLPRPVDDPAAGDGCGIIAYDTKRARWQDFIILDDCDEVVGTAVDPQGRVWAVERRNNRVYRYDPTTGEVMKVEGLVKPYSYGDLIGMGLKMQDF